MHYVFKLPGRFDITNGSDLLGVDGFDTRSSGKGYIATGKGYNNLTFQDSVVEALHDIDFWPLLPIEAALKLSTKQFAGEHGDLEMMIANQPLDLDVDEVKGYLNKLPIEYVEDGGNWLRLGMALRHQFSGSEEGWKLFDAVSQRCPEKYDREQNRRRWDSLGKKAVVNPVTFATVIEWCGGKGVAVQGKLEQCLEALKAANTKDDIAAAVKDAATLHLDELTLPILIGEIRARYATVVGQKITEAQVKKALKKQGGDDKAGDFYDEYVFLTATGEYMHRINKSTMGPRAFDVAHSRDAPLDADGNPQRATGYADNKIRCVYSGMYAPQFGDFFTYDGIEYFNTFRPCDLTPKEPGGAVAKVKRHIAHLLPDEYEQGLFINYLAHNVQRPGVKLFWAMVLQGVQGDGKSFFAEMMQHVLGRSNCKIVSAEVLDEQYTAWAEQSCMTFFEEIKLDNFRKYEILNKLKPFITNPVISVRRMYRDTYEAINTTNYVALTNHKDCLPIDDTDRRYCVLYSAMQSREQLEHFMQDNPDYYPDLYDSMRKGTGEILAWLKQHPIPDSFLAMSRAPSTRAKEMMRDMAKGDDWLIVEDAITAFKAHDINDFVVNITKLQKAVSDSMDMDFRDFPKTNRLKNILSDMGYQLIGVYKNDERKNQRIYCKDEKAKAVDFSAPF
jgi:hypothetical protein